MEKQKQMIIIGSVVGVVVLAGGAYFLMNRGGGDSGADTTTDTQTATKRPPRPNKGTPPGNNGGTVMAKGPAGGVKPAPGPSRPMAGRPLAAPTGPGGAAGLGGPRGQRPGGALNPTVKPGTAAPMGMAPNPMVAKLNKNNKDPFVPWWPIINPPPPPVFEKVQVARLASPYIISPPPPNTEIREVPTRRVSGILSGDGVYAILEGGDAPEIVKPGGKTSDGYRVVSITADSVKLQKKEGNVTRTQIVQLSDVPPSGAQPASYGGRPGQTGGPGVGRPGGPTSGGVRGKGGGAGINE